jgi:hypothetical protein
MGVSRWPALRDTPWLLEIVENPKALEYWRDKFDKAYENPTGVNFWDYQWTFACWAQNGLSVLPNVTLISNIGFGEDATHTKSLNSPRASLTTYAMNFPLQHPPYRFRNREADVFIIDKVVVSRLTKRFSKLRRILYAAIPEKLRNSINSIRLKFFKY